MHEDEGESDRQANETMRSLNRIGRESREKPCANNNRNKRDWGFNARKKDEKR
jgi:hypothetical protein